MSLSIIRDAIVAYIIGTIGKSAIIEFMGII